MTISENRRGNETVVYDHDACHEAAGKLEALDGYFGEHK